MLLVNSREAQIDQSICSAMLLRPHFNKRQKFQIRNKQGEGVFQLIAFHYEGGGGFGLVIT